MKIKRFWPLMLFATAFIVCLVVFYDALPLFSVLQAPDATPGFGKPSLFRRMLPWMSGIQPSITHDDILKTLPALAYHELSFILSTSLLALAMGTYLRMIGLPVVSCFAGGLALAFSGYHFTLFNAGHRGYFIMMPYAVFLFALVERGIARPRWFHFALMSVCMVCGLSTQPDVFAMLLMLVAAYGVFRLIQVSRTRGIKTYFRETGIRLAFGVVIASVTFLVLGFNTVSHVLNVTLAGREKLLAQTNSGVAAKPDEQKTPAELAAEKENLWIFATNWSLPPEDMAEFIAPCLRGLDTNNPKGPYWGRLGRNDKWSDFLEESEEWRMQRGIYSNFRQHTLYLGAIPIAFAFFAVLWAMASFVGKRKSPADGQPPENPWTAITLFWLIAALVCLLLAFGRYAPFYRLFYSLPLMDKIRAPVKFVHLVEISVSVLFAIGTARLLRPVSKENDKRFRLLGRMVLITTVIAAATCMGFAQTFSPDAHSQTWAAIGIPAGQIQNTLVALYKGALMRAAWLFVLSAIAISAVAFAKHDMRQPMAAAFAVLMVCASVLDMGEVGRRYVVVQDVAYKYARNPVAEKLAEKGNVDGQSFSYLQLFNKILPPGVPFLDSLGIAGVIGMDPTSSDDPSSMRVKTLMAFEDDLLKRWKYWGASAVFALPNTAVEMTRANMTKILGGYDLDPAGRLVNPKDIRKPQVAVVEPVGMIPSVAVFYGWKTADADKALSMIAEKDFDMDTQIVVEGEDVTDTPTTDPYTPATWVASPYETHGNKAVVKARAAKPGMLFVRENSMRAVKSTATVNGKAAPLYKANGMFLCVPVGAGDSTVIITPYVSATHTVGTAAALAFAIFALVAFIRSEAKSA